MPEHAFCFSEGQCLLDIPQQVSMAGTMEKALRRRSSVPKDFGSPSHELNFVDREAMETPQVELNRQGIRRIVMNKSNKRRLLIIRALRAFHVSQINFNIPRSQG